MQTRLVVLLVILSSSAIAAPPVEQAAFQRPAVEQSVTFARRAPQTGDTLTQRIESTLALATTSRQEGKVLEEHSSTVVHRQQRTIVAAEVAEGRTVAAQVTYHQAERESAGQSPAPDAVMGKTYTVRMHNDQLQIVDAAGAVPPLLEFQRVSGDFAWLGQPHPLAEFFGGRTFTVGQRLELPAELARQLVAFDRDLGEVEKFVLVLRKIEGPLAKFETIVDVASHDNTQLRLAGMGRLVIDSRSCRAVEAELSGPLGLSETRGGVGLKYQVTGAGKLAMQIETEYRDAAGEHE